MTYLCLLYWLDLNETKSIQHIWLSTQTLAGGEPSANKKITSNHHRKPERTDNKKRVKHKRVNVTTSLIKKTPQHYDMKIQRIKKNKKLYILGASGSVCLLDLEVSLRRSAIVNVTLVSTQISFYVYCELL